MAGSATLFQTFPNTKSLAPYSLDAFKSSFTLSPSRVPLGGGRPAAVPSSIDTSTQSRLRTESGTCSSSSQNLSLYSSRHEMGAVKRTSNGHNNRQITPSFPNLSEWYLYNCYRSVKRLSKDWACGDVCRERASKLRKKRGVICSALAPASSTAEEKEYEFDSPKMKELVAFLEKDLVHLFDEQGIDKSMYDKKVEFKDPITKYESLDGYLFNIQMLRRVLTPRFELHSVTQTGPKDITTRWTMTMYFVLLPWRPELIFTGTSVMSVNEETGKFCRHVDLWDSIQNNDYFSFEAVADLYKQLHIYKTPDLETPRYKVLKRTAVYEVRQYEQFLVAETPVDQIVGNKGFNAVAGYLFGQNSEGEKMKMTTPVFNQSADDSFQLQFVLPLQKQISSAPSPLSEEVKVRPVEKTFSAVLRFSGETDEETVKEKERLLRAAVIDDKLQPEEGFLLARYNDPGRTWAFMRRNEVIIWLKDFVLETV